MNDDQKRAFEYVGCLLKFYGDYRTQKEREAYVVTALYLGATGAVLADPDLHRQLVLMGVAVTAILVVVLISAMAAWKPAVRGSHGRSVRQRQFPLAAASASRRLDPRNRPVWLWLRGAR